jgi:hypothetical protein
VPTYLTRPCHLGNWGSAYETTGSTTGSCGVKEDPKSSSIHTPVISTICYTLTIMLSLSKVLFCAPYLVPILASAQHPPQQGPFALTLNPTSIIASRVNSSGLVELRTYQATSEHISYFDDTISHFDQHDKSDAWKCNEAAISTSRTAIAGVTEDLTETLGHRPKILHWFALRFSTFLPGALPTEESPPHPMMMMIDHSGTDMGQEPLARLMTCSIDPIC